MFVDVSVLKSPVPPFTVFRVVNVPVVDVILFALAEPDTLRFVADALPKFEVLETNLLVVVVPLTVALVATRFVVVSVPSTSNVPAAMLDAVRSSVSILGDSIEVKYPLSNTLS